MQTMTPSDAWATYVGDQTPEEFSANCAHDMHGEILDYVYGVDPDNPDFGDEGREKRPAADTCLGLVDDSERSSVAALLTRHARASGFDI
jgi:hypothetical protein